MRLPIPDDWDGVEYCLYEVCWPNSEKWKAVLRGLVSQAARGWSWDEKTGDLLQTLGAMRSVLPENLELREVIMSCSSDQFDRLIDAVLGIRSAVVSINCGCGPGGQGGITYPPATPGEEGGEPPAGYGDLDDGPGTGAYQTRKCKVANYIHEQNVAIVEKVVASDFLSWVAETYGELLTNVQATIWIYLIGELSTPWPIIDGLLAVALAWSSNVLEALLGETDVEQLLIDLNDNQEDLVCALYNATNALQATNDYLQVLADNGVSVGNREIMLAIMVPELTNLIFFQSERSEEIESAIADYFGPVDCDFCGDCDDRVYVDVGTVVSFTDTTITVQSVMNAGLHRIAVYWRVEETSPGTFAYCVSPGVEVSNVTTTNNLVAMDVQANPDNALIDNAHFHPPNSNLPVFPYTNVGRCLCAFNSGQSGQMTFTFAFPEEE